MSEMLQQFLSGEGPIDPARLAGAAGMPSDPDQLQALMAHPFVRGKDTAEKILDEGLAAHRDHLPQFR